jgi:hypothetical protein
LSKNLSLSFLKKCGFGIREKPIPDPGSKRHRIHNNVINKPKAVTALSGTATKYVAEAYTTQPNSKASSRVLYNIFESTCGG